MTNLQELFEKVMSFMNTIIEVLVGLALLGFLWGIFKYFVSAKDSTKREDSKRFMTYGIISLLVIVSLWGFVFLLGDLFGIQIQRSGGDVFEPIGGSQQQGLDPTLGTGNSSFFGSDAGDTDTGTGGYGVDDYSWTGGGSYGNTDSD